MFTEVVKPIHIIFIKPLWAH